MGYIVINNETLRKIEKLNNEGENLSWVELMYYKRIFKNEWDRIYKLSQICTSVPEQTDIYNNILPKLETAIKRIDTLTATKRVDEHHDSKTIAFSDINRRLTQLLNS